MTSHSVGLEGRRRINKDKVIFFFVQAQEILEVYDSIFESKDSYAAELIVPREEFEKSVNQIAVSCSYFCALTTTKF